MNIAVEVNMETLITYIDGVEVDGVTIESGHFIFDNITPHQAFTLGKRLGFIQGFNEGFAANDE